MRLTKKKGTTMLLIRPLGEGACTKWTVDLHAKFMEVVQQFGEGVEIEEDGSSCQIYESCTTTWRRSGIQLLR